MNKNYRNINIYIYIYDGFGGLVVSILASGTQVCGFKPGRSRWNFTGVKILSMPSSGGESLLCPSFATQIYFLLSLAEVSHAASCVQGVWR